MSSHRKIISSRFCRHSKAPSSRERLGRSRRMSVDGSRAKREDCPRCCRYGRGGGGPWNFIFGRFWRHSRDVHNPRRHAVGGAVARVV